MKKSELVVLSSLTLATTTLLAAAAICLSRKNKHKKRMVTISDAGYETAYDVHFPLKYKR